MKDGKLHKGLHYSDFSYNDFGRKKRSLLTNDSNYYGLPYKIHSATPGYKHRNGICKIIFLYFLILNI